MVDEEILAGGNVTRVVRIGGTVRRAMGAWSAAVHDLLRHLEARGFEGAPRFMGVDAEGREMLTFVAGEIGHYPLPDYMWSDTVLVAVARLLRDYHAATRDYLPPPEACWLLPAVYPPEVICHNDFAPYNMVFRDGLPRAIIDFDTAAPGSRIWDVAYAAYRFVPLSYAPDMVARGLADVAEQRRRLHLFCDGYGLPNPHDVPATAVLRLEALNAHMRQQAEMGDPAYQKMIADGHHSHYAREIAAIRRHAAELSRPL